MLRLGKVNRVSPRIQKSARRSSNVDFDLNKSISLLERTPRVLESMLSGLGTEWTDATEGADTWSPFNVLGHLIDGEETDWMGRTRIILGNAPASERRFVPFEMTRHLTATKGRTMQELLARFAQLRGQNIAELRSLNLKPADLERTGVHPKFGTVTLSQMLATWTVHDLAHIAQISRVMANQYKEAVGPWREYLGILGRAER
jgi:hypothetical protein